MKCTVTEANKTHTICLVHYKLLWFPLPSALSAEFILAPSYVP